MITKEQFAAKLNGREYGDEMSQAEDNEAKSNNLIVVFGCSDDICSFRGAIDCEEYCYGGGEVLLWNNPEIGYEVFEECGEECKYSEVVKEKCIGINAQWDTDGYSWTYYTEVPHAKFDILEDGEKYCRGIVLNLKDMNNAAS